MGGSRSINGYLSMDTLWEDADSRTIFEFHFGRAKLYEPSAGYLLMDLGFRRAGDRIEEKTGTESKILAREKGSSKHHTVSKCAPNVSVCV
jgi:hypothetical protein